MNITDGFISYTDRNFGGYFMNKAVIYIHGKGGEAGEAAHYSPFL